MARGSDAAAAATELQAKHGVLPNVEELILANQQSFSPALRKASARRVNQELTDRVDLSRITPSRGGKVVMANVRGEREKDAMLVYVAELPGGSFYKDVVEGDELAGLLVAEVEEEPDVVPVMAAKGKPASA